MEYKSRLMTLIEAGRREEAFELVERLKAAAQPLPTAIKVDRTGTVTFYKGDRRFVKNAEGKWELAPRKK